MDILVRSCCALIISLAFITAQVQSAPASGQPAAGNPQVLYNIILELENVLYKLKDYAREVHSLQSQRKESSAPDGKSPIDNDLNELQQAAGQQQQQQRQPPVKRPNPGQQAPSTSDDTSDISLKDALEYLVNLAKEKKIERRDHDIPFPLTDREGR